MQISTMIKFGMVRDTVKNYYCDQIASNIWAFVWHIYIWRWHIPKIKVKVMSGSTMNIFEMVADRVNITIVVKLHVTYMFHWHMCIWNWHILKGKVKVFHSSTVNSMEMMTDNVKITIAIKSPALYGFSIGMYTFNLDSFWRSRSRLSLSTETRHYSADLHIFPRK